MFQKFVFCCFSIAFTVAFSRSNSIANEVDSLRRVINTCKDDTILLRSYISLGECFYISYPDSALEIWTNALYRNDSIIKKNKNKEITHCLKKLKAETLTNIGYINWQKGMVESALDYFMQSLKIYEELNDEGGIASTYNFIGGVYEIQNDYQKSIEFFNKALKIYEKLQLKSDMALLYNNLSNGYINLQQYDNALPYLEKAYIIFKEVKDWNYLGYVLNNFGAVYYSKQQFDKSLEYYFKCLEIRKQINDKVGLTDLYANISNVYKAKNQRQKAKHFAEMAYILSLELKYPVKIKNSANKMRLIHAENEEWARAYSFFVVEDKMKDSIYNMNNLKRIFESQVKYGYEKKKLADSLENVRAVELKNLKLEQQKQINRTQKYLLYLSIAAIFVLGVMLGFVYKLLEQKRKTNALILEKNNELINANEEIETQRNEIFSQKEVLLLQKKNLDDSINYAQNIQRTLLYSTEYQKTVTDRFVLYKPKDVVSGDFYWEAVVDEYYIFCVADCTGHGIPGAFMSILGITFLNDCITRQKNIYPGKILGLLRELMIKTLKQKFERGEMKDGMDISLGVLNCKSLELKWAGANLPLFVFTSDHEFIELKPDKMPIGIYFKDLPFTEHSMQLKKDSTLYMFSDGYPDQIGGPENKRFTQTGFKTLIQSVYGLPLADQQATLNSELEKWMLTRNASAKQLDDITVLGIKI